MPTPRVLAPLVAIGLALGGAAVVGTASPATAAAEFDPLAAPQRIADTRPAGETVDDQFEGTGKQAAETALQLQIGGRAGVPTDAAAAVLNVTAVAAEGPGFFTVYPCDQARPNSSNLNYGAGQVIANAVFARLDATGKACVFTKATAHIIVDVTGSLPAGAFEALAAPQRIADTRPAGDTVDDVNEATGKVAGDTSLEVVVAGRAGLASDVDTAVMNVTVTNPEGPGFVTVYPCDQPRPNSSNLNYQPNQVSANSVVAKVDGDGKICLFTKATANLIVDVTGSLPDTTFVPLAAPSRLVDTRSNGQTIDDEVEQVGYRRAGTTLQFPVGGRAGIPAGASAVVLNVTATQASSPGFMTLHPRNSSRPNASNLNFVPGTVVPNTVIAGLGGNGMICLFSSTDAEAIVDVAGYFMGPAPVDTGRNCPFEFPGTATYPVGPYQMPAGRYVSESPTNNVCEFFRWNEETFLGGQLGANVKFGNGRLIADVRPTDPFVHFRFASCSPLVPYEPSGELATSFTDGDHIVNDHIVPGTYRANRIDGRICGGEIVSSFDGAESSELFTWFETTAATVTIVVQPSDLGVSTGDGCTTWTKIG